MDARGGSIEGRGVLELYWRWSALPDTMAMESGRVSTPKWSNWGAGAPL